MQAIAEPLDVRTDTHVLILAFLSRERDFFVSLCHFGPQSVNMSVTGSIASCFWHEIMYRALAVAGQASTKIRVAISLYNALVPIHA